MTRKYAFLILASSLLAAITTTVIQPVWPFLVEEAGVDPSFYGVIVSGSNLMEFLIRWTFAAFSPASTTFLIGSASLGLSAGVLLLGTEPLIILASLSSSRVGRALHLMGRNQIVSSLFKDKPGTAFGSIRAFWLLGGIAGPALGAYIAVTLGRVPLFLIGLAFGLLSVFLALPASMIVKTKPKGELIFWKGSINARIKWLVFLTVLNNFARNSFIPFHLVLAPAIFSAKVEHIALAAVIERGISTAFGLPVGWLSDRVDRRYVLAGSEVFMSLGILVYILGRSIPEFLISSFLLGLGMSSYAPVIMAAVTELSDRPEDAVGFLSTAVSFSRLPAPLVTGFLIWLLGYRYAFVVPMAFLVSVALGMMWERQYRS